LPEEARDEVDWEATGFRAGLRGEAATIPGGVPPRFHQAYLKGHEQGLLRIAPRKTPEPAPVAAPVVVEEDFEMDEAELRAQAGRVMRSEFMDTSSVEAEEDDEGTVH